MVLLSCVFNMLAYILAQNLFFQKKVRKPIAYIVGLAVFAVIACMSVFSESEKHLLIYVVTVFCCFFSFHGNWKTRILPVFTLFFIMTAIYGVVQFIYDLFFFRIIPRESVTQYNFFGEILSICILCMGVLIKNTVKKERKEKILKIAEKYLDITTIITALIITFTISLLEYSKNMISDDKYQYMAAVVSGIAYVSVFLLCGMTIYVKHLNEELKSLMNNELMMKDMQKKYYEALLDQEKETRAYRHDMANHMLCLSALAEKGDLPALRSYLDDMQGELNLIKGKNYRTGNEVLDIMSNFYIPQLSDKIRVNFQVKAVPDLDDMKICTIYANLLQNAIEELSSDPNRSGILEIFFQQEKDVYRLMMANSVFRRTETDKLVTHKEDKKNHGLGLKNVKRVVNDLGGKVWISKNDEIFKVIVELKTE